MDFTGNSRDDDEQDRSTTHFPFSSSSSVSSPQYRGFFPLSNNVDGDGLALASATAASTSGGVLSRVVEKEHMFDKVVTPSDVGKLNRLVIPKQHAEKYFPLDSTANEKGLLLNFEDRTGNPWRFRYSYWNSSQSYVMTKGWSRFVKEKKLDAGDIVSFQRGAGEEAKDRLFIDWRRRQNAPQFDDHHQQQIASGFGLHRSNVPWSPLFLQPPPSAVVQFSHHQPNSYINYSYHPNPNQNRYNHYYYNNNVNSSPESIIYLRSASAATQIQESGGNIGENRVSDVEPMVFDSVPVVHGTSTTTTRSVPKKLRLFGVNMERGVSSSSETLSQEDESIMMKTHHESKIPFTTLESTTRLYNGIPVQTDHDQLLINKGKSSNSMSLDLDIGTEKDNRRDLGLGW